MSTVEEREGLATIEDITMVCLGIRLGGWMTRQVERACGELGTKKIEPSKGVWEAGRPNVRFSGGNER